MSVGLRACLEARASSFKSVNRGDVTVSERSCVRSQSISTAMSLAFWSRMACVSVPVPGPTSRTRSLGWICAAWRICLSLFWSCRKF